MYAREEILQIYKTGPEAVVSLVQRLEATVKHQEILIENLKREVNLFKEQGDICDKLTAQMELVDAQLKMLDRLKQEK